MAVLSRKLQYLRICGVPSDEESYLIVPDDSREWPEARAKRTK
jgi:hypothetical protein